MIDSTEWHTLAYGNNRLQPYEVLQNYYDGLFQAFGALQRANI